MRRCAIHPRTPENTYVSPIGRNHCRACRTAAVNRYRKTEKGKQAKRRYNRSEKGHVAQARYNATTAGFVRAARYYLSQAEGRLG